MAPPGASKAAPAQAKIPGRPLLAGRCTDVYMVSFNRKQLFPNVFYKTVSSYWAVSAACSPTRSGLAGATPESEPVIQVKGTLAAGASPTRWRRSGAATSSRGCCGDDIAPAAPGKAKVRFLDAALDLPTVDIAVAGGC